MTLLVAELHLRALLPAELFSESTLYTFWATHPMFEG